MATGSYSAMPAGTASPSSSASAPHGASATSNSSTRTGNMHPSNSNTADTPTRLSRGNSFRIPLPPNSPSANSSAISPSSPGGAATTAGAGQLASSYGSSTTSSRLGSFALGFRRNRGASTNRGEITSPPVNIASLPGSLGAGGSGNAGIPPPSPPAFPSLQASTSLTDFGIASPYFDGGHHDPSSQPSANQATSPSGHTPSASISGGGGGTRGYFTRRGFGRKNTGSGLLGGGRTPTSEQPPSVPASASQSAMQRSRSSSQPSLPLSVSGNPQQPTASSALPPNSANAATMVFTGSTQPVLAPTNTTSQSGAPNTATSGGGGGTSSSNNSSRRTSGEAARTSTATSNPTSSSLHTRTSSQAANAATATSATTSTAAQPASNSAPATATSSSSSSETQHIRLVPHLESTRSLHFEPVSRDVLPTIPLRIGRFTDRNPNQPISSIDQNRVAFKSKVVSRTHAEIWYDPAPIAANTGSANGGGWFIRDLKSSSGTFLNHIRLSGAGMESRPFPIRDGDVLQLGVDYQGGTEEIYRCVKMRIELNRGWQRGANSFNTNALRQIRALGNVLDQPATTTQTDKKKKKKKRSKKSKKDKKDTALENEDDGTASDGAMQVEKKSKTKEKHNEVQQSGVTDCCICLFSVTVYQALFIAPCSHIFHFKCIRPLLMQHHPGFSCPLCRTFGDLEADVEQDDLPEPIQEASSSSSSESGSEDEDENENAPSLPEKDLPASASVNAALASEHTAVQSTSTANAGSSDPNLDTLRPGRRSPMVSSVSEFGSTASASTSQAAPVSAVQAGTSTSARASPRPSLDVVRPASPHRASGAKTPPSRGSRVSSSRHVPPSGAAVAAALEPHITTPHNHHHHHHHHHSQHSGNGDAAFSPPSAGDFDPDIRRGSIYVHGADGHAMHIPITGRSRPGSVHEAELSSDAHHHHLHSHNQQSPSVTTTEKNKARSVRSMRMTKSKTSMTSLKNAAATGSSSHGPSASTSGHRRKQSAPSSEDEAGGRGDDDTSPMDIEEPLTARPMPGAISAPGQYPFPDAHRETSSTASGHATGRDEDVVMEDEHDTTPPMSNKEDSEGVSDTNNAASEAKGKGKATRSDSSSTHRDISQPLQSAGATDSAKASREEPSASVHAVV